MLGKVTLKGYLTFFPQSGEKLNERETWKFAWMAQRQSQRRGSHFTDLGNDVNLLDKRRVRRLLSARPAFNHASRSFRRFIESQRVPGSPNDARREEE